jgi:hypothetical protein
VIDFKTGNDRILETCELFLVAAPWNRPFFDVAPFGLPIAEHHVINPLLLSSEVFLGLLERLDALTFGPEGMPMPRWVFYNGSELPGGIVGFGRPASALSPSQREQMRVPDDYDGLVPFSMFIAIPTPRPGTWMAHNLASINQVFAEERLGRLGSITKAFGLKVFRTQLLFGATQWHSVALVIHTKFGPLDLLTAFTPAHSDIMTLTYRVALDDLRLRAACNDPTATIARPEPDFWLEARDVEKAKELQDQIEVGARYQIVDRPRRSGERIEVPLVRLSDDPEWDEAREPV